MTARDDQRTAGHDDVLAAFTGKRLVDYRQAPYAGKGGHWRDDEPLYLIFEDGTELEISAGGFHDSGSLYVATGDPS